MVNNIAISCEGLARSFVIFIMDYQFANSLREKSGIQVSIMLSQNTATPVVHTSQRPAPKPGESLVGGPSAASGPSVVSHTGASGVAGEQSPSRCTSTSCGSRGGRGSWVSHKRRNHREDESSSEDEERQTFLRIMFAYQDTQVDTKDIVSIVTPKRHYFVYF